MTGLTVTELHTQDGYDWPNGVGDERWPVPVVRAASDLLACRWPACNCHSPQGPGECNRRAASE